MASSSYPRATRILPLRHPHPSLVPPVCSTLWYYPYNSLLPLICRPRAILVQPMHFRYAILVLHLCHLVLPLMLSLSNPYPTPMPPYATPMLSMSNPCAWPMPPLCCPCGTLVPPLRQPYDPPYAILALPSCCPLLPLCDPCVTAMVPVYHSSAAHFLRLCYPCAIDKIPLGAPFTPSC